MTDARMPTAGELRDRITLETRAETPDAETGGLDEAFATLGTVSGKVEAISGGRYVASLQTEHVATHRALIRWRSDYRSIRFVLWRGRRAVVRSVRELDPQRRFLELLIEELGDA
jgi:SPP1 family predicted phage head-tail adaptor